MFVFENIKKWRKNQTTIVITHDLSQITPEDFVYVMKDGTIAEQGFRSDLSRQSGTYGRKAGVFAQMAAEQAIDPLPPKLDNEWHPAAELEEVLANEGEDEEVLHSQRAHTPSFNVVSRPASMMYFDIIDDYARGARYSVQEESSKQLSASPSIRDGLTRRTSRPMSMAQKRLSWSPQELENEGRPKSLVTSRRESSVARQISFDKSPSTQSLSRYSHLNASPRPMASTFPPEKEGHLSVMSLAYRQGQTMSQNLDDELKGSVPVPSTLVEQPLGPLLGITGIIRKYFSVLPQKYFFGISLLCAIGHGIVTPVWSTYIAALMALVGGGGTDVTGVTRSGLILLALSIGQAVLSSIQYYLLERMSGQWATIIRLTAFRKLLLQDKAFFDLTDNAPARLVQILVKDADDMRPVISKIVGKCVVVVTMIGLGLIWAMVDGWRLTLLGMAIVPFFGIIMVFNTAVLGKYEILNKSKRETLGRTFYEVSAFHIAIEQV